MRFASLIRPIWPAIATLLATMLVAAFIIEFTFTSGAQAFGYSFFRFLRLTVNLSLALLLLPALFSVSRRFLNRGEGYLIRVKEAHEPERPFNHSRAWALRPLQGIGLLMLMATHFSLPLARFLGDHFAGPAVAPLIPPGEITQGRFLNVGITSLLLGFVWTMEDLGIRHYNRERVEILRVAKYLGSIVPILTGFYGVYSLFNNEPTSRAVFSLIQRVVIFYPPMVVFTVMHGEYIRRRKERLLEHLRINPTGLQVNFSGSTQVSNKSKMRNGPE